MSAASTTQPSPTDVPDHAVVNPWTWQDAYGFVQGRAVREGGSLLFCAGQTAVDDEGVPLQDADMAAQLNRALDNLERVLAGGAASLADVVRLNYYVTDMAAFFQALDGFKLRLQRSGCRPASTLLRVVGLHHPAIHVELEATAVMARERGAWVPVTQKDESP